MYRQGSAMRAVHDLLSPMAIGDLISVKPPEDMGIRIDSFRMAVSKYATDSGVEFKTRYDKYLREISIRRIA